jgi:hypothetical protein
MPQAGLIHLVVHMLWDDKAGRILRLSRGLAIMEMLGRVCTAFESVSP